MSLRTPLARALNHGAAHDGVGHWWLQRASAVALAPLAIWLLVQLLGLPGADYGSVQAMDRRGLESGTALPDSRARVLARLARTSVVIEDYVHGFADQDRAAAAGGVAAGLLAASGVYAVLRIALRGPV